jgi:hypothetical protein
MFRDNQGVVLEEMANLPVFWGEKGHLRVVQIGSETASTRLAREVEGQGKKARIKIA